MVIFIRAIIIAANEQKAKKKKMLQMFLTFLNRFYSGLLQDCKLYLRPNTRGFCTLKWKGTAYAYFMSMPIFSIKKNENACLTDYWFTEKKMLFYFISLRYLQLIYDEAKKKKGMIYISLYNIISFLFLTLSRLRKRPNTVR